MPEEIMVADTSDMFEGRNIDEVAIKYGAKMVEDEARYEDCPYFEKVETDYDITNGHSSYECFCTKNGRQLLLSPVKQCEMCLKEKEEPMKQDKSLSEWTLGEVREQCRGRNCAGCVFYSGIDNNRCSLKLTNPTLWNLTDPPRFTEEEVADAKALMRLLPYTTERSTIWKDEDGVLSIGWGSYKKDKLAYGLFPSIRPGESYMLSEIVGGANED